MPQKNWVGYGNDAPTPADQHQVGPIAESWCVLRIFVDDPAEDFAEDVVAETRDGHEEVAIGCYGAQLSTGSLESLV